MAGEGARGAEAQGFLSRREGAMTETDDARRRLEREREEGRLRGREPRVPARGPRGRRRPTAPPEQRERESRTQPWPHRATPEQRREAAQKVIASRDPKAHRAASRRALALPEVRKRERPLSGSGSRPAGATARPPRARRRADDALRDRAGRRRQRARTRRRHPRRAEALARGQGPQRRRRAEAAAVRHAPAGAGLRRPVARQAPDRARWSDEGERVPVETDAPC